MYATCLSCHAPLGANEMIEHFPVGRKLAFDQARGRLWAVCTVCLQWNLAALDERWEAIEEAERLYHDARLRASTDNIGLARMRDGSELVRVGEPKRPEFAAWRYGERFAKRWRIRGPATAVAGAALVVQKVPIFLAAQFASVLLVPAIAAGVISYLARRGHGTKHIMRIPLPDGRTATLTQAHIDWMRVERDTAQPGGWRLRVKHSKPGSAPYMFEGYDPVTTFSGEEARRIAAQLLPRVNRTGGRKATVAEAVEVLERAGNPDAVFRLAVRARPEKYSQWAEWTDPEANDPELARSLTGAAAPIRLAVEMAAHEEQERQLMQGELTTLEDQWREAEEIAAIADSLTLPPALLRQMERLRLR